MLTAIIDADNCVGCTRCIDACPVDAIVGAHQFLHTVLLDECIGCKLCITPCPVDCIEMVPLESYLPVGVGIDKAGRAQRAKERHKARQQRLALEAQRQLVVHDVGVDRAEQIKQEIAQALQRVAQKNAK